MKKIVFLLFCLAYMPLNAISQQKIEAELSNAEKFSTKSGTLFQKEFVTIGPIVAGRNIGEMKVVHYTDLMTNESLSSLRISCDVQGKYTSDTKIGTLDKDEVDGLIKSFKIIMDRILVNTPSVYTEISFSARSGYSAGCYYSNQEWSVYMKLEKYDGDSYLWMKVTDLPSYVKMLEEARSIMK